MDKRTNPERLSAEVLHAMERLNSWVRSRGCAGDSWNARYVIYDLKLSCIDWANRNGAASHRWIEVGVRCRDCCGTGKYVDSYGEKFDHCHACYSKGRVMLRFMETVISLPDHQTRWHTPITETWKINMPSPDTFETDFDWNANLPGSEIPVDELARLLNLVENCVPYRNRDIRRIDHNRSVYDRDCFYGDVNDFASYKLRLGRKERPCRLCLSSEMETCGFSVTSGRIHWAECVCKFHYTHHDISIFGKLKSLGPPKEFLTPNVKEWIALHPVPIKAEAVNA